MRTTRGMRWGAAALGTLLLGVAGASTIRDGWPTSGRAADELPRARVTRGTIATFVKATGVVRPMTGAQVRVGARLSGIVRRLYVRVGDRVRAGQRLAEIDDRDLVALEREAAATLARAETDLQFARADAARTRRLSEARLVPAAELEARDRAASSAAQQVLQARAALEYAATQRTYARVDAPIAGSVASVSTQEGETVAASFAAPTFVTLLDLERLEVWAYVDETDIGRVHRGQHATFTVDTYGDEPFEGVVHTIYPQAEVRDNVVNYVAVIRFRAPRDRELRPEMTTAVRIAIDERTNVLTVPVRAVQHDAGQAAVWRYDDGRYQRVGVTLGARDDMRWEVTRGVREGEMVAIGTPPVAQQEGR